MDGTTRTRNHRNRQPKSVEEAKQLYVESDDYKIEELEEDLSLLVWTEAICRGEETPNTYK